MTQFSFHTISAPVEDVLLKEKGSKFIGFAYPAANEEAVKAILTQLREAHPKATHHCYAFRLGSKGEHYRANDDGEPSGSAGLPIYNQLLGHALTNILLVVVRYYGGTKLGVSGLIKAYKETAKLTLEQAHTITDEMKSTLKIRFPFSQQNSIFTALNKIQAEISHFDSTENCEITAVIKTEEAQKIPELLSGIRNISFDVF